ncbi:hypothetical protein GGR51DRAFT_543332 [Nemania sp. FL0031]|nr:hypothetical protein GGR51DRAFT_543332 [Nemania sp. FL0031]
MFFTGSLQDGISTALQEVKQVVCFVTDEGAESRKWEDEFLTDDSIRSDLESQSVILRLPAGSQEAGYLEALFPVPKKPTIVVIRNGQLKEYIAAGASKEEFVRRLSKTIQLNARPSQPSPPSSVPATTLTAPAQNTTAQSAHSNSSLYDDDVPPVAASVSSSVPAEEEKRLSAEKKGKAKAVPENEPPNPEQAHANEIKLRKHHANEERKRILKRIEDDKRARKERDAAERRARALLSADPSTNPDTEGVAAQTPAIPLAQRLPVAGTGDHCNLQVRLLDGSTIRSRFASDVTLGADVRRWIDEARTDGDAPYSFRVVLTPQPNRAVAASEEGQSLLALGLAPSATLVLIPAPYSIAYARAGGVLAPVLGVVSSICGAIMASVGGFFALFFGAGSGHRQHEDSRHENVPMEDLQARRRRDAQLYNGNSLNFEPRNEDEDDNTR